MALIRYPNFTGGNFQPQNPLASRERTINFSPELLSTPGATNRLVLNPTPGVRVFTTVPASPHRGLYEHNGRVYCVSGDRFYEVLANGTVIERGTVAIDAYPATLHANGEAGKHIFITSGDHGYIFHTATNSFLEVLTAGAAMGQMLDGFFLALNRADSSWRVSNLLDGYTWQSTQRVTRSAAPDPWRSFAVHDKLIALFGDKTTEFWYNAGGSPFPFDPVPNAVIPYGIHAPFSPQSVGGALFWLARTSDDINHVVMAQSTNPQIVSTPSTHWALSLMPRTDDAIGFADAYLGHLSYGVTLATGAKTAVYDLTTQLWHDEGTWLAEHSQYDAARPLYRCFAFGKQLISDRTSGIIYERSPFYTTDVDGRPLRRVRRPPLLFGNGQMLAFPSFELLCEVGLPVHETHTLPPAPTRRAIDDTTPSTFPQVELRRSNDGGQTWWSAGFRSSGAQGEFGFRPQWNRLGATDQLAGFEVVMTSPIPWRIVDALIDVAPGAGK